MNCCLPLLVLALAGSPGIAGGQVLVNSATNYSDLFSPDGSEVTVDPLDALIGLRFGGSNSGPLNSYLEAEAEGGVSLKILVGVAETGAQVALNDGKLQFNISNNESSILGALGTGLSLDLDWSATATFNKTGSQLLLAPNTTYQLTFDVNGSNGLLNSTLGIFPKFGIEFLDGAGNAIDPVAGYDHDAKVVNVIGLELLDIIGSPPESGRAVVQFQTGNTVASGPAGVRFTGSAVAPATVLSLGTEFASITNLQIAAIPEPSVLGLVGLGAFAAFRRRRAA
ncbi:PEP-CTERM sorting domain-containing protein [Luteolibacter arcticus]|uniref:PEP-CTERM sorting domain-containing protein n=1 Tax=Luteolibacter arcticus TaxID=1581411 RepID=A0ABT3GE83_9BACT|nr:PEP-CTERM sorting domain-containing protein [Luteolibacter arcticus]MCW1921927.1 PEP-CTERM sorting domain-containing protein [Luteolibacter arcticus]